MKEMIIDGAVRKIKISDPILYIDNKSRKRSGHVGHALVNFGDGKIIAFNGNTSPVRCKGHSEFGWVEYRLSEDYGETFGEIQELPYAKQCFLNGDCTISVEKAVACDDGTVIAFCLRNSIYTEGCSEPWDSCMVVRSYDKGETWDDATLFCKHKGRIYDACYRDGVIYALIFCNDASVLFTGNNPLHVYRLYKSEDNGKTFEEVCVLPLENTLAHAYCAMTFNDEGEMIVYVYNAGDERNLDYLISPDCGKTWTRSGKAYFKNKIRNPQINRLDGQYIMHGRAGAGAGFVFYTSADGIEWDDGVLLDTLKPSCYYSNNVIIREPGHPDVMLIKFSELYSPVGVGKCVNGMMIRLTSIK